MGDTLIQWGSGTFASQSFNNDYWGSFNRGNESGNRFTFPISFSETPQFFIQPIGNPVFSFVEYGGVTKTQSSVLVPLAPKNYTSTSAPSYRWFAIGKK